MAGLREALVAAVLTGGVLLGAVACGGSSTVEAPTTAADGGTTDGGGTSSGPTTLPATAPSSSSGAASANPKDAAFVAKLRTQGLVASDENIVGAGGMVCAALAQNPSKTYLDKTLPTYVKAMIGQSRVKDGVSAEEADKLATADATKLIAEAKASYCKA